MKKTVFAVFVLVIGLTLAGCGNAGRNASNLHDSSDSWDGEFEDFLVERCVREALGKSWDENVTEKELASLKELTISWKKDLTLGMNIYKISFDFIGYVNLADLKFLTGLEDLKLDFNGANTVLENMDAIACCSRLKSLTMPLSMWDYSPSSGYIGKGYRYLRNIFERLPALETVDFGMSVPESLKDLLQPAGSDRKIAFAESENSFQMVMGSGGTASISPLMLMEEEEDILFLSSRELMQAEQETDAYEKYQDVVIYVDEGEVFDCETLSDFRNIETLVIFNRKLNLQRGCVSQVIHPEALSKLPNLGALSLYNMQVDFEECEFSNLRELYLTACEFNESFGLLKLPRLREMYLFYNNRNEGGIFMPGSDLWSNMSELNYLFGGYVTSEEFESLADIFSDWKDKSKLETMILLSREQNGHYADILPQITDNLALKTLFLYSGDADTPIDLEQIKCYNSLENFACLAPTDHLAEFLDDHPSLTSVTESGDEINELLLTDADAAEAYLSDFIEAAVRHPNLSKLSASFSQLSFPIEMYTEFRPKLISLYEAGIYDAMTLSQPY